jgi:hypothetical protein
MAERGEKRMTDEQRTLLMLIFMSVLLSAALPFIVLLE